VLRRCVWSRNIKNRCSIYIYNVRLLRVNQHIRWTAEDSGSSTSKIAIPVVSNVNAKENEKNKQGLTPVEIDVSRMWKVRTKIVPVIIGALGTIKKGLDKNLQVLPGHPSAIELRKITWMGTAHSTCKVLVLRSGLSRRPPHNN